jgi:hypothetical protein
MSPFFPTFAPFKFWLSHRLPRSGKKKGAKNEVKELIILVPSALGKPSRRFVSFVFANPFFIYLLFFFSWFAGI